MNYINLLSQLLGLLTLFLIDLCGIIFFKQLFFQSVLCFYIVKLFKQPSFWPLLIALFFIHLEWFLLYDSLSLATLFLLPVTTLVLYLKKVLVPSLIYPPVIFTLCVGLEIWLIHMITGQTIPYNLYTIGSFIANMILLLSNSLIW
jgi:hypothetical protein